MYTVPITGSDPNAAFATSQLMTLRPNVQRYAIIGNRTYNNILYSTVFSTTFLKNNTLLNNKIKYNVIINAIRIGGTILVLEIPGSLIIIKLYFKFNNRKNVRRINTFL